MDSILNEAYYQIGIYLDRLPYPPSFEELRALVERLSGKQITLSDLWARLLRLRKDGELIRLGR